MPGLRPYCWSLGLPTGHRRGTRLENRLSFGHATTPASKSRRFPMVVALLSHRVFLRALAYERVVRSVASQRWKPLFRRRSWWCAVQSLAKCCALRVPATHPFSVVSNTSAFSLRNFRLSGVVISYVQLRTEAFEACPHETAPSVDSKQGVSAFADSAT